MDATADQKITELTAITALTDTDLLVMVDDVAGTPVTRKITWADLKASLAPAWAAYTPAWTSSGTAPAFGDAVLDCAFMQIGKLVHFRMDITFGSTTTFGTGNYSFSLPVTAKTLNSNHGIVCSGYMEDAGVASYVVTGARLRTTTTISLSFPSATTSGVEILVQQTTPFTWASGDFIRVMGSYEAA